MKTLIILTTLLISNALWAKDYSCNIRNYTIDLDLYNDRSTHIWVRDRYNYHTYAQAYAGSIERGNKVTSFFFYAGSEPIVLSFRNIDVETRGPKIKSHIDTVLEGFILKGYLDCFEK